MNYVAMLFLDSYAKLPTWVPVTRSLYIKPIVPTCCSYAKNR